MYNRYHKYTARDIHIVFITITYILLLILSTNDDNDNDDASSGNKPYDGVALDARRGGKQTSVCFAPLRNITRYYVALLLLIIIRRYVRYRSARV